MNKLPRLQHMNKLPRMQNQLKKRSERITLKENMYKMIFVPNYSQNE